MIYGACSDVGKMRKINQDSYYLSENTSLPLFVVADGMGGHNAGEIASSVAIKIVKKCLDTKYELIISNELDVTTFIEETLKLSNKEIYKMGKSNIEYNGMGTTITIGCIKDDKLYIGHIGDSRAYIINKQKFMQITQDHSLVAELVKNGSISEDEATNHPQKNVITRALGTDIDVKVDISEYKLERNDIILLCTDGLTNMVSENIIKEIIMSCDDLQKACETLIENANKNGGKDNSTVMLIKVEK